GDARRAGGRRSDRHAPQELRLGVHRALEHAARPGFRPHRGVHAGGRRSRGEKTVAALRLQNLRKSFGGLPAISDVSLEVALGEPLAGRSREERATVKQLIAAIPREVTVVMIEHDMDTALDMAERITVLHYGRVIVEGTRAEVVADPKTREVYLGH